MRAKPLLVVLFACLVMIAPTTLAQEATEEPQQLDLATLTPVGEENVEAQDPTPTQAMEVTFTPSPSLTPTTDPLAAPDADVDVPGELNEIPDEILDNADDWPLANRDYRNTRAVTTSNINSSNVDQLEVAWMFPIPGRAPFGAAASAPLIADGVVYFQDLASNVFAIDLYSGTSLWEQMYDSPVIGPNGPGIGYERVFVITGVNEFAALDMATGTELWTQATEGRPTGAFQPYAYGGFVYFTTQAGVSGGEGEVSFRGYEGGTSGHILALNPDTGETVWDFQTVEEGFWGNPELNSGGGVWYPPGIDVETGITYWGTGNPAPFPGTFEFPNAQSREEPNLYTNSLIALAHDTGELLWYNHVNPNDLFDLDFQAPPILATVEIEMQPREIIIGSGKLGDVIAFDRETGEILWRTPVGIHQNDELTAIPPGETVTVYPGILGGVETPMAYADGVVYAPVLNLPTEHDPTGWGATTATEALNAANDHTPTGQGTSEVVALDAATGQVLWSHEFGTDMYGGATVVGDLVFVATFDGMIYALERASGQTVWSYQAPAGINAWPAVAEDMIVWPAGFGNNPVLIALRLPVDVIRGQATEETTAQPTEQPADEATRETTEEPAAEETAEATEVQAGDVTPQATATPTTEGEATSEAGEQAAQETGQQSEYVRVDEENQTVTLTVIAALDDTNGGLNFNGYANGNATFVVPQGWTVEVEFRNQSSLPHSAMIVPQDAVSQQQLPDPVFEGAAIDDPYAGTTEPATFTFTAAEQGSYALACGVPGHAASGHWINFEVAASDAQPEWRAGG